MTCETTQAVQTMTAEEVERAMARLKDSLGVGTSEECHQARDALSRLAAQAARVPGLVAERDALQKRTAGLEEWDAFAAQARKDVQAWGVRAETAEAEASTLRERVATLEQEKTALLNMEPVKQARTAESRVRELEGGVRSVEVAIAATLGGSVEGNPTSTINYLQRARELVETEARVKDMRAALSDAERDLRTADRDDHWGGVRDVQKRLEAILLQRPVPSQPLPSPAQGVVAAADALADAAQRVEPHLPALDAGAIRFSEHAQASGGLRDALAAYRSARSNSPTPPAGLLEAVGPLMQWARAVCVTFPPDYLGTPRDLRTDLLKPVLTLDFARRLVPAFDAAKGGMLPLESGLAEERGDTLEMLANLFGSDMARDGLLKAAEAAHEDAESWRRTHRLLEDARAVEGVFWDALREQDPTLDLDGKARTAVEEALAQGIRWVLNIDGASDGEDPDDEDDDTPPSEQPARCKDCGVEDGDGGHVVNPCHGCRLEVCGDCTDCTTPDEVRVCEDCFARGNYGQPPPAPAQGGDLLIKAVPVVEYIRHALAMRGKEPPRPFPAKDARAFVDAYELAKSIGWSPTPPPGLREAVGRALYLVGRWDADTRKYIRPADHAGDCLCSGCELLAAYDATGGEARPAGWLRRSDVWEAVKAEFCPPDSEQHRRINDVLNTLRRSLNLDAAEDEAANPDAEDAAKYRAAVEGIQQARNLLLYPTTPWDETVPEVLRVLAPLSSDASPPAPRETLDKARVVEVLSRWRDASATGAARHADDRSLSAFHKGARRAAYSIAYVLGLTLDTPPSGPGGGELPSREDVLNAFSVEEHPSGALERYQREHPTLAQDLAELARDLSQPLVEQEGPLPAEDEVLINKAWTQHAAIKPTSRARIAPTPTPKVPPMARVSRAHGGHMGPKAVHDAIAYAPPPMQRDAFRALYSLAADYTNLRTTCAAESLARDVAQAESTTPAVVLECDGMRVLADGTPQALVMSGAWVPMADLTGSDEFWRRHVLNLAREVAHTVGLLDVVGHATVKAVRRATELGAEDMRERMARVAENVGLKNLASVIRAAPLLGKAVRRG